MMLSRCFKMAISSIWSSKVRALLTMLGIIIGIASVIIIVSLINGFSTSLNSTFEAMGTNKITATISHPLYSSRLTPDDIFTFAEENSDMIKYVSPTVSVSATLKNGDISISSSGTGVSETYLNMQEISIGTGDGINYVNVLNAEKVIVLGSYNALELFGNTNPIGEYIKVNGERFLVVGILEEVLNSEASTSDDVFYMSYSSALALSNSRYPTTYVYGSYDDALATKDIIDTYYTETLESSDYHRLIAMEEMMAQVNELTGMLTLLLVGIAGISLFVGGIGIMNIMLVSVTERTREIGIRKSLGGKRRDILTQFIIEAGVTSSFGGLIGVVIGIAISFFIGDLIGLTAVVSIPSVLISFGISTGIGVFFGYFPALKASKLNPIDALRYD
ncbi:MAG: ABC transporter permease [Clostridia bacterium]